MKLIIHCFLGYFTKHLESVACIEGAKAVLLCEVLEVVEIFEWFKDGVKITNGEKYRMTTEGKECRLEINSVGLQDTGTYCFNVKEQSSSAYIHVQGKNYYLYLFLFVVIFYFKNERNGEMSDCTPKQRTT